MAMPEYTTDGVFEMQWGFVGSYYSDHTTGYGPRRATLRTSISEGILGSLKILAFQNIQILSALCRSAIYKTSQTPFFLTQLHQ